MSDIYNTNLEKNNANSYWAQYLETINAPEPLLIGASPPYDTPAGEVFRILEKDVLDI